MRIRLLLLVLIGAVAVQGRAWAAGPAGATPVTGPWAIDWLATDSASAAPIPAHAWQIDWQDLSTTATTQPLNLALARAADGSEDQAAQGQTAPAARPIAYDYSDAYNTRRKIHMYASFATLPLFVTQYVLGQKLYDYTASDGERSAHSAVATGIAVLFGVNSVTGVWNLWEARKDPNHRTKRTLHGILMLGADAGFVATGMLAPDSEGGDGEGGGGGNRSTHRTVALTSMGVATFSYLMMLFTR